MILIVYKMAFFKHEIAKNVHLLVIVDDMGGVFVIRSFLGSRKIAEHITTIPVLDT